LEKNKKFPHAAEAQGPMTPSEKTQTCLNCDVTHEKG